MKRIIYTMAILTFLGSAVFAQNDTTAIEEEVIVEEEVEASEEPLMMPDLDHLNLEINEEVQGAIEEAMREVEEAMREAQEALEEMENDTTLTEAQRAEVREKREKLMEMESKKIKIVVKKNDDDSVVREREHTVKIKLHDDRDDDKHSLVTTDWFNMQFGWANVINQDGKVGMPTGYESMNFKGNSSSFHLSILEQAWNLIGDNVRFTYGLGFTWNFYNLEDNARLYKDQDGVLLPVVDENIQYDRNRLNVTYATMPVGLQLQLGHSKKHRIKIGGGINMGYLLGSAQRLKWEDNGEFTAKIRNNYNLETFRLGYQAQVGYGTFHLYGRYFPNSMFKKDLGPDVNQFSVGVMIGSI